MFGKGVVAYLLFQSIVLAAGQQTFEGRGDHYSVKASVQRFPPLETQDSEVQANDLGELFKRHKLKRLPHVIPHFKKRPWRQGDRVSKEEVIQNLARAIDSRRVPPAELKAQREKENKENLNEYAAWKASMANRPRKIRNQPVNAASNSADINVGAGLSAADFPVKTNSNRRERLQSQGADYRRLSLEPMSRQQPRGAGQQLTELQYKKVTKTIGQSRDQRHNDEFLGSRQDMQPNAVKKR